MTIGRQVVRGGKTPGGLTVRDLLPAINARYEHSLRRLADSPFLYQADA